jgi:glycosyltransferase involved in cell wall biosynthesis
LKKPKIAVFGLKGLPAFGGAATVGENIIKNLKDYYEFTVYATSSHTNLKSGTYEFFNQIVFKKIPFKRLNTLYYFLRSTLHALFLGNYDLIHLHHRDAAFIILLLKIRYKVVTTTHGSFFARENEKHIEWYLQLNEKYFIKYSDYITCVSKTEQELYKKHLNLNVEYIPNGIEEVDKTKLPHIPHNDYILFAAGRIIRSKGCELLLKALESINYKGKILIAGDLSDTTNYTNELYKLSAGLDVEYLGLIRDKQLLYSYFNNAKLFVFPSEIEAMSMILLEAASVKSSIVCSDIKENKDIFEKSEVLFFKSGDVQELGQKINYALSNPDKMKALAENAYERVNSTYRWDKIVLCYAAIYDKLLNKSQIVEGGKWDK